MGFSEFLVIVAVVVIVVYSRRIGELGGALGRTFGSFKKGLKDERASRDVKELGESPKKKG